MSLPFDLDDGAIVLPTERHPRLALAAEPAGLLAIPGWIVMRDYGGYDGGLEPEEPHKVYFTREEAERVAEETPRLLGANQIIELSIPTASLA